MCISSFLVSEGAVFGGECKGWGGCFVSAWDVCVEMFVSEGALNYPSMTAYRRNNAAHPIEKVGAELRGMMPWITKNALVDKDKN